METSHNIFSTIDDHLVICDECNLDMASCECHHPKMPNQYLLNDYERDMMDYRKALEAYNALGFFSKLFATKPKEPQLSDYQVLYLY